MKGFQKTTITLIDYENGRERFQLTNLLGGGCTLEAYNTFEKELAA